MSVPVEITVTYTAEDLAITSRHVARRGPAKVTVFAPIIIVVVLTLVVNFAINPLKNLRGIFHPRTLSILFLIALIVVLYNLFRRRKYGFLAKRYFQERIDSSAFLREENVIRFSDAGVWSRNRLSTTQIVWEAYTEIEETDDYLYFYTSEKSAQIFPKRAFSEHDLEMLRLILRSYVPPDRPLELLA